MHDHRESSSSTATPRRAEPRARLRTLHDADLPYVVGQHLRYFPGGFFARLGRRFLHRYYLSFLTSPVGVAVAAESAGEPVGYLVGVTDPAAHRAHVLHRHGRRLALLGAVGMLLRPRLAWSFLRTRARRYLRRLRPGSASGPCGPRDRLGVLAHVAVDPRARERGIGGRLVDSFEEEAVACGCERLLLVTAADGTGAGDFYRRRGWCCAGEHDTPDGQRIATYEIPLTEGPVTERPATGRDADEGAGDRCTPDA